MRSKSSVPVRVRSWDDGSSELAGVRRFIVALRAKLRFERLPGRAVCIARPLPAMGAQMEENGCRSSVWVVYVVGRGCGDVWTA